MTEDVIVVVALPGGVAGAFPMQAVIAAQRKAAELGFGRPEIPDEPTTTEKLMTSHELAELIGCNDTLIEQMARDKRIPCVRVGKLLRFEPAAVLRALKKV